MSFIEFRLAASRHYRRYYATLRTQTNAHNLLAGVLGAIADSVTLIFMFKLSISITSKIYKYMCTLRIGYFNL